MRSPGPSPIFDDPCGGFGFRLLSYLLPPPSGPAVLRVALDWDSETQWLREMVQDADALDAWENEGGR